MSRIKARKQGVNNSLVFTNQDNNTGSITFNGSVFTLSAPLTLSGAQNLLANGSAAAPSLAFSNSIGVGLYRSASNVLGFATAGSARLTLSASGVLELNAPGYIKSDVANAIFPIYLCAAEQFIAAATGGPISIATYCTTISTDGGGDAFSLASGSVIGQVKKIKFFVDGGGDAVVTSTFTGANTTLTFSDAGEFAILMWDGTDWIMIESGSDLTLAHQPVLG
jgi:hypothetical protein